MMNDRNDSKDILEALYRVKIAIESLNPDPEQTIAHFRRAQKFDRYLTMYSAVASTLVALALIGNFMLSLFASKGGP